MQSMTGYGRGYAENDQMAIEIDIKSVNNRYLDIQARVPQVILYTDPVIKNRIKDRVKRGRLDVYVRMTNLEKGQDAMVVDQVFAQSVHQKLEDLRIRLGMEDPVSLDQVIGQEGVIVQVPTTYDQDQATDLCLEALDQALEAFQTMRAYEGDKLHADMACQLETMGVHLEAVKDQAPELIKAYETRMRDRMAELLQDTGVAEDRLLTEVAIFAEKSDINEEVVRLAVHIDHFSRAMEEAGAIGKKLDFLCQEMNREVNTISSKSNDTLLTTHALALKHCVEQIREQVQNVE